MLNQAQWSVYFSWTPYSTSYKNSVLIHIRKKPFVFLCEKCDSAPLTHEVMTWLDIYSLNSIEWLVAVDLSNEVTCWCEDQASMTSDIHLKFYNLRILYSRRLKYGTYILEKMLNKIVGYNFPPKISMSNMPTQTSKLTIFQLKRTLLSSTFTRQYMQKTSSTI